MCHIIIYNLIRVWLKKSGLNFNLIHDIKQIFVVFDFFYEINFEMLQIIVKNVSLLL